MKFKSLLISLLFATPLCAMADSYPMHIAEFPQGSGFKVVNHDEATDTWTLEVETNDGGGLAPVFTLNTITEAVPAQYTAFCFEYRSTAEAYNTEFHMYKLFLGSLDRGVALPKIKQTDEWTTVRLDLASFRSSNSTRFLNKAGQFQQMKFYDLPVGAVFEIRNIRYDENEAPFKSMVINLEGDNFIEAEDFNIAADGASSYTVHKSTIPAWKRHYHNPHPGRFPVFAWCSVDIGGRGWGDEGAYFLNEQYKELEECGFTITHGSAYPGVDNAFLFDNQTLNTDTPISLHEGTNLMMMCSSSLDSYGDRSTWVPRRMQSDRLAGYFIKDEPFAKDFDWMESKLSHIRSMDPDHLYYANLHNINSDIRAIGFNNYDEYANLMITKVGSGFLSYDYYPVRQYDDSGEIYIEPNFFHNLEVVSKIAKYYGTTFWAFAHSVASECHTQGVHYPSPQEDHMRVQIFGNIAYGAQGIQYFTYKCPSPYDGYVYYDAPIDLANERTATWYMVRNINRDVHALTWVFLGADMLRVGHTNAETPIGCVRLTPEMLPAGIKSVSADGQGVCVSMLQNGTNLFMMVLNADIHNTQKVTISKDIDVKRVLMDGTTEKDAAGTVEYDVTPGHFVLYLVSENEEPLYKPEIVDVEIADYRDDTNSVCIVANENASNGHYLANMGDTSWNTYSSYMPTNQDRAISRESAIANWGAAYTYTVEVAEDMEADIYIGHSVPWTEYGKVKTIGAAPGYLYSIAGDPTLNWTKEYAGSMILSIDGVEIAPSQTMHPSAPATYDESGSEFDAILADKSRWIANADDNVLYFWPKSGSDLGNEMSFNETPDYQKVALAAGTHKIRINSLSYPWHFDNINIVRHDDSSVKGVIADAARFNAVGVCGAIVVETDAAFKVFNMAGSLVAAGSGDTIVNVGSGLYIVASLDGRATKVAVR